MARPPGRVCAHTPVAVNLVDSFGDFDIVGGDRGGELGAEEVRGGLRRWSVE